MLNIFPYHFSDRSNRVYIYPLSSGFIIQRATKKICNTVCYIKLNRCSHGSDKECLRHYYLHLHIAADQCRQPSKHDCIPSDDYLPVLSPDHLFLMVDKYNGLLHYKRGMIYRTITRNRFFRYLISVFLLNWNEIVKTDQTGIHCSYKSVSQYAHTLRTWVQVLYYCTL